MNTPLQKAAQALIQQWDSPGFIVDDEISGLRKALDAEIAQSVEPVAWTLNKTIAKRETTTTAYLWFVNPVNTSWTPLYLHPPQQAKQAPLSDEQIDELAEGIAWDDYAHDLTRRVEKHHGIGGEA